MATTAYSMLMDIDAKSTVPVLRITFAFLSSATLLSLFAVLTYIKAGTPDQTYIAAMSTIINAVAAYHYYEITKVRKEGSITLTSEWSVEALRHSDWAVTMPLLVLKLYALINNPEHDLLLQSVDVSALCATIMVLLGAWVRLGLDEMAPKDEMAGRQDLKWVDIIIGTMFYLISFALLIVLIIDLCLAYNGVDNTAVVYSFFLVWPCYGITHLAACLFRACSNQRAPRENYYPKNLSLTKDVIYAALDIFSKAVFAWYTSSMAFNKSVLSG